jgi:ubiquinone/menaquinone biosynthesis C-methylase UbiE
LHVLEGSADDAPLPDSFADVVLLSGVISLMTDLGSVFAEAARLLKGNGRVAIADLFSNSEATRCSPPNIFRSVEDVTRALWRQGFSTCSLGFGSATPDVSWAAAAQAVDDWIDAHCVDRAGYAEWDRDRRHLRDHIESGNVIGGCIVAAREEFS